MKTLSADFLSKQVRKTVRPFFKVELFRQFSGAITDRDSATQIKVSGNATSLFSNGDRFIIPLYDIEAEHLITSAPAYASSKTTIVCSGSSFASSGLPGLYVAKKYNVTSNVLDNGISPVRISTEGEALNSSMADDISILLDNTNSVYYNKDGSSGILNTTDIFWVRVYFCLHDAADAVLVFAGTVYHAQPIGREKIVKLLCMGHLKELERYPGWYVNTQAGECVKLTGVELLSLSGVSYEGRKTLKYQFPDGEDMPGLVLNSVSANCPAGWHVLKFQPPDLFQFDYGEWEQETEDADGATITSNAGHSINVDLPKNFYVDNRHELIFVENEFKPEIVKHGRASIQLDNGKKFKLKTDFEEIIRYDDGASTYYYHSRLASDQLVDIDLFEAVDDVLYIISPEPFYGVEFELDTDFVGTFTFQYARGKSDWATLTKTDGTSNFSQSGVITWNHPADWRQCNQELNSIQYQNMYFLVITCATRTSGTCKASRILRYFRIYDDIDAYINLKIKLEKLPADSVDEEILAVYDSSAVIQPCTWKQNQSLQNYLETLLTEAKFRTAQLTITDLKISSATPVLSLYGQAPKYAYPKRPTALCVDTAADPDVIYLGIEDEVWKVTEKGEFTYLFTLPAYYFNDGIKDVYTKCKIERLAIDGNGYLQGIAFGSWNDYYNYTAVAMRRPCIVFRSTDKATLTSSAQVDSSGDSVITPMTRGFRAGSVDTGVYYIGNNFTYSCGENIAIPFPQVLRCHTIETVADCVPYSIEGLTGVDDTTNGIVIPTLWEPFLLSPGHYFIQGGDHAIYFPINYGQPGLMVWNETTDEWLLLKWDGSNFYIVSMDYSGFSDITDIIDLSNYQAQPFCAAFNPAGATEGYLYIGLMTWDEAGATFPGDYSDCSIVRIDVDRSSPAQSTIFSFASDAPEANQSLDGTALDYCTLIDLVYNDHEATLHGVVLDRSSLQYHYIVYDIANDKLYATQTGTGFTFSNNKQIKNLIYNAGDYKVYAVVTDPRYQEDSAYLISAEYAVPGGAPDGTEITLTYCSEIMANEWDSIQLARGANTIYGITGDLYHYLWQYSTSFYPRFFYAQTNDDNFRDILDEIAEALNMVHSINANRGLYFLARDGSKGSFTLEEKTHYLEDSMSDVQQWRHYYDGVEVRWENPLTGQSGTKTAGTLGFNRRILKISNYFIQYPQLAQYIADAFNTFFSVVRDVIEFKAIGLWQLENRDKLTILHEGNFDFVSGEEFLIDEVSHDFEAFETSIKAIEK